MARRPLKKTQFVPHAPSGSSRQVVVRLKPELWTFVDREVERLRRENPGLVVTPSDVVRMGLARLQAEREGSGAT